MSCGLYFLAITFLPGFRRRHRKNQTGEIFKQAFVRYTQDKGLRVFGTCIGIGICIAGKQVGSFLGVNLIGFLKSPSPYFPSPFYPFPPITEPLSILFNREPEPAKRYSGIQTLFSPGLQAFPILNTFVPHTGQVKRKSRSKN